MNHQLAFIHQRQLGKEKEVIAMEQGGNRIVNRIFEASLHRSSDKPTPTAEMSIRNRFCRRKYIDRKHYLPAEYLDAMKSIRRAEPVSHNNMQLVNPFLRDKPVVSQVNVKKEIISDADFFKSISDDEDWENPFQVMNNAPELIPQQRKKDKYGNRDLSRSWHPESPSKSQWNHPSEVASYKTRGQRDRQKSKCGVDLFMKQRQLSIYEQDGSILYSHCKSDSVVTPSTVTSTTRSSRGNQSDMLSATCHPSLAMSNRCRSKEVSSTRRKMLDHMGENHVLGRLSDLSLKIQNDPAAKPSRSSSASGRPRVQRRASTKTLMRDDVEKAPRTTTASNLVVEALLDFIQSTTDVTEEEINMIMKAVNNNESLSTGKRRDDRNRDRYEGDHQEDGPIPVSRNARPERLQRSASLARQSGRERSRSSSRTRATSRSRRAVISRRDSLNGDLDEKNMSHSPKRNRNPSLERKSRARQGRNKKSADDTNAAAEPHIETESVKRSTPFGSSRRKSSKSREPRAHSRSGSSCGRPVKRNDSGRGDQKRGGSLSGRRRRGASHDVLGSSDRGGCGDVPRRQMKSLPDPISVLGRSLQAELVEGREHAEPDKQQFEKDNSFGSWCGSRTVSEASDIVDEDDQLIL
jgi:hypothetical protein